MQMHTHRTNSVSSNHVSKIFPTSFAPLFAPPPRRFQWNDSSHASPILHNEMTPSVPRPPFFMSFPTKLCHMCPAHPSRCRFQRNDYSFALPPPPPHRFSIYAPPTLPHVVSIETMPYVPCPPFTMSFPTKRLFFCSATPSAASFLHLCPALPSPRRFQ